MYKEVPYCHMQRGEGGKGQRFQGMDYRAC